MIEGSFGKRVANVSETFIGYALLSIVSFAMLYVLLPTTRIFCIAYFFVAFFLGKEIIEEQGLLATNMKMYGSKFAIASLVAGGLVVLLKPVSDLWYYGQMIMSFLSEAVILIDLINYHNIYATRRLQQFNHMGGDDRA